MRTTGPGSIVRMSEREQRGLQAPGGVLGELEAAGRGGADVSPKRRRWRLVRNVLGALLSVALFVWALRLGWTEQNIESVGRILGSEWELGASLVALTVLSIIVNGLTFWILARPVAKLRASDVVAVNAMATFLALLPFKVSVIVRGLVHHRRDGVRFKDLVSWFASASAFGAVVLGPIAVASLWRGELDALWWLVALGGSLVGTVAGVVLGRLADRFRWLHTASLGADRITRDARIAAIQYALRVIDAVSLCLRFWVAAQIVEMALGPSRALLLGTSYFLLTILAPSGALGVAEAGTSGVGALAGFELERVAGLALVVTAANATVALLMALVGAWWLRLDRVLFPRDAPTQRAEQSSERASGRSCSGDRARRPEPQR